MPSKFFISLIAIILVNITISETEQNGNGNTTENTSINNNNLTDLCVNINASSRSDCFILSNPDSFCCYNSTNQKCISVLKSELKNTALDCGITDNNYGKYEFGQYHPKQDFNLDFQTCGEYNPKEAEVCLKYSEIANSCCFFKKGDQKACLAIGRRYIGKGKYKEGNEVIIYECNSFNNIVNLLSIILKLLLL